MNLDDYIQKIDTFAELLPDSDGTVTQECGYCGRKLLMNDTGNALAMPARDGTPCCSAQCRETVNILL